MLGYQFQVSAAGNYEVWSRIGFEGIRSPFEWRIDQGAWQPVKPTDPSIDLTDLATWSPVAWLKLGKADLAAGKHAFEFRRQAVVEGWRTASRSRRASFSPATPSACRRVRSIPTGSSSPARTGRTRRTRRRPGRSSSSRRQPSPPPPPGGYAEALPGAGRAAAERPVAGGAFRRAGGRGPRRPDHRGPGRRSDCSGWARRCRATSSRTGAELLQCHRLIYRTRVKVPAALAGRSFIFRFPAVNLFGEPAGQRPLLRLHQGAVCPMGVRCHLRDPARRGQRSLRRDQGFLLRGQPQARRSGPTAQQLRRALGHVEPDLDDRPFRLSDRLGC